MAISKNDIYAKFLKRICSEDPLRLKFHTPFSDGVDICSSDVKMMLRVKPNAVDCHDVPQYPEFRVNVEYGEPILLPISSLKEALSRVDHEKETIEISSAVPCDECDGDGSVEFEYTSKCGRMFTRYCDCPICDGTGKICDAVYKETGRTHPKQFERVSINGVLFDAYRLYILTELCDTIDICDIRITALHKNAACSFQINEDCEFVLMPMIGEVSDCKFKLDIK